MIFPMINVNLGVNELDGYVLIRHQMLVEYLGHRFDFSTFFKVFPAPSYIIFIV